MRKTEAAIRANSNKITDAARILIGLIRGAERSEGARSTHGEVSLEIELTGGGIETWKITIERTASSH
jgi:hypothetical protein